MATFISWDIANKKQREEAKKIYQKARNENQLIVDGSNNPIEHFTSSLTEFYLKGQALKENESSLKILNDKGDEFLTWDSRDKEQVKEACALFKKFKKKGWRAYTVGNNGKLKYRIFKFDDKKEEIYFKEEDHKLSLEAFVKEFKKIEMTPRTYPG